MTMDRFLKAEQSLQLNANNFCLSLKKINKKALNSLVFKSNTLMNGLYHLENFVLGFSFFLLLKISPIGLNIAYELQILHFTLQ